MIELGTGVYILWLRLSQTRTVRIGSLGEHTFSPGYYAYVGSAQKGLWHRLHRHARVVKPLHWHIDYLRQWADLVGVAVTQASKDGECDLAAAVASTPGSFLVMRKFGASDCRCDTHLYGFVTCPAAIDDPELIVPGLCSVPLEVFNLEAGSID